MGKIFFMKIKLASWNVNGIRACVKKGFVNWVKENSWDIICLQETKFSHSDYKHFPEEISKFNDYHQYFSSSKKKGYSGVGILTKIKPIRIIEGIDEKKFDDEGRTLTLEFSNFYLTSSYFPNSGREHERVSYKMEYCKAILHFLKKLQKKKPVIICGDFNIAHTPLDLKNPKSNINTSGFLPIERKWLDVFIKNGFCDVFRHQYPDSADQYTWWTYRGDCRKRNIGWRLDYFFTSKNFIDHVQNVYHQADILGSDHCPVAIELKHLK